MFSSVLIANRGEIACRIICSARELGLRTIAVYSSADRTARHVRMADKAVPIGGARPEESYLNGEAILAVARAHGAECIHPGYGFLAENAAFAEACARSGVVFVGPPPDAIRIMGRKDEAKALMAKAGVPVIPGYEGDAQGAQSLARAAEKIGYPVMIKAVAGGGGTGLRRVESPQALSAALEGAQREADAAFGDARVILEKCLERPRHIELQILADGHGHCLHLFERDCSLQRRHQKIIEEAPAPGMPEGLRRRMGEAAVAAARAVDYVGAGTVEFLVEDVALSDSSGFFFLEMNTRLQVEHPVTEEVTGLDLVAWQFRVAAGERLAVAQDDVRLDGHAIEARLYAEDPDRGFLPASGRLHLARWPSGEGVRVETGFESGDPVSPHYDAMLAKIIARGRDRAEAMARLRAALESTAIAGVRTNLAFLCGLLADSDVRRGAVDTGLVDRRHRPPDRRVINPAIARAGIGALLTVRRTHASPSASGDVAPVPSPWEAADGFSLSASPRVLTLPFRVDGEPVEARVCWTGKGLSIDLDGHAEQDAAKSPADIEVVHADDRLFVLAGGRQTEIAFGLGEQGASAGTGGDGVVRAPMYGRIAKIHVAAGDAVAKGYPLAVLEAMKMEHILHAPTDGTIADLPVAEQQQVEENAVIAVVRSEEQP